MTDDLLVKTLDRILNKQDELQKQQSAYAQKSVLAHQTLGTKLDQVKKIAEGNAKRIEVIEKDIALWRRVSRGAVWLVSALLIAAGTALVGWVLDRATGFLAWAGLR